MAEGLSPSVMAYYICVPGVGVAVCPNIQLLSLRLHGSQTSHQAPSIVKQ